MRASAWSLIQDPWWAQATTNGAGIEVRVTNLLMHYVGRCDKVSLYKQLVDFADKEVVLERLHECLEKDPKMNGGCAFCVRPGSHHELAPIYFEWSFGGAVAISVGCQASANAAECIRDELLLPSMRANVAAKALLPTDTAWPPAGEAIPLPNFADSSIISLCQRAESRSSRLQNAAGGGSSSGAAACGGGSSGGGGGEAGADGSALDERTGAAQTTAEQAKPSSATTSQSATALVETEEERRKRVAKEKREKAVNKAENKRPKNN